MSSGDISDEDIVAMWNGVMADPEDLECNIDDLRAEYENFYCKTPTEQEEPQDEEVDEEPTKPEMLREEQEPKQPEQPKPENQEKDTV